MYTLTALLQVLANQNMDSNVGNNFQDSQNSENLSWITKNKNEPLMEEMKKDVLMGKKKLRDVKNTCSNWHFWSTRITEHGGKSKMFSTDYSNKS